MLKEDISEEEERDQRDQEKKYGGRSREDDTMKFWCRRKRSRGRSVLPSMDMVRLLEAMMAEH